MSIKKILTAPIDARARHTYLHLFLSTQVGSFDVGEKARFLENKNMVKKMQIGYGGWHDAMDIVSCFLYLFSVFDYRPGDYFISPVTI